MNRGHMGTGPGGEATAQNAAEEYQRATGILWAHDFAGSSLTARTGGLVLANVNGALVDQDVSNTLDGGRVLPQFPLLSDPPSFAWSHRFASAATNSALVVPSPTSIDFAEQSFALSVTARWVANAATSYDFIGNRTATSGVELRYNQTASQIQTTVQVTGESPVLAVLDHDLDPGEWHDIVVIVDRTNNTLQIGTENGEMLAAFADAGSLTSSRAFSLFAGRALGLIGDIMGCRIAFGSQVERRSPKAIALAIAKLIWLDDAVVRVVADAK